MAEPTDSFDSVDSSDEFQSLLETLMRSAHESGVDVRGSWEMRNGPEYPDWETQISELQKHGSD